MIKIIFFSKFTFLFKIHLLISKFTFLFKIHNSQFTFSYFERLYQENEDGQDQDAVFELPPDLVNPQKSPCVNVPEWFVKEGGELCLSDTKNGLSIIRYWPKFLSEKGNHLMFKRLRKYCKWHQKQIKIGGEWKYETRLVAWYS